MSLKNYVKELVTKFKIFMWYLGTEPFRQFRDIWILFVKLLKALNKTLTWAYIALVLMIISFFFGKKYAAGCFLVFFLVVLLMWEWERGFFMHRYRQKIKKKVKKEVEKNEWDK